MSRQRQQVRRALAERDAERRFAEVSRAVRLQTSAMLIEGQVALPVAEAWLLKRRAARGEAES